MPRINFQQQLVALKDKLLAMAALSQQALEFSVEAYLTATSPSANHVLEIEAAINAAETSVDEMAYELLAKEQPMAIDLRFILSVIKINGDLERIGDQATNIAPRAERSTDQPAISLPVDIETMGDKVGIMIRTAIQALLEADAKLAETVLAMDDEVDDMNRAVQTELVEVMQQHSTGRRAGAQRHHHQPQPRARRRPRHQHRRRRHLLGPRLRRPPPVLHDAAPRRAQPAQLIRQSIFLNLLNS